jgi:hypothetical protein
MIDVPTSHWPGNCYSIASAIVKAHLVKGRAVHGHWLGPIAEDSFFADRRGLRFTGHGWIVLADGRVLDPTRWVFEAVEPYLYLGESGPEYDEGGDKLRRAMTKPPPPWTREVAMPPPLKLTRPAAAHVTRLLGKAAGPTLSRDQLFWLANLPFATLEPHAAAIYYAIERIGRGALVPIDNMMRAGAVMARKAVRGKR